MKKFNLFVLLLVGIILHSCCDDSNNDRPIPKKFDVDTLLVVEMTTRAAQAGPELKHFADSIAQLHGGKACPVNLKTVQSTIRKCWTDSVQADKLNDLVRLTIACPFDSLRSLITDLADTAKKRNMFYRYKHQEMLDRGYWGDMVNLIHFQSIVSEVQVKSFYMTYATYEGNLVEFIGEDIVKAIAADTGKEPGHSHVYYEIMRDITGKYSDADKEKAMKESYDYLHSFWQGYQPGMKFYDE